MGRMFDLKGIAPTRKGLMAAGPSTLIFVGAWLGAWTSDTCMHLYHHMMHGVAPKKRSTGTLINDTVESLSAMTRAVVQQTFSVMDLWWSTKWDAAILQKVGLTAQQLHRIVVTPVTSRTLALKFRNFATIRQFSSGGVEFCETEAAFEAELVSQAADLHNRRAVHERDMPHLSVGVSGDETDLHDSVNFRSHMELPRKRIMREPYPDHEGSPPSFNELLSGSRRSVSEATSLDEFRASIVRPMDGFGPSLLCSLLHDVHSSLSCRWLSVVLHLCLRKKPPTFLVVKPVRTPVAILGSLGMCIYVPASRHWLMSYSPIHLT